MDTHTRSHTPRGVLVGRVYLHTYSLARRPFAIPARTPQREKVPLVTVPGPRCEWGGPALFVATGSAVGGPAQPGSRRSARGPGDHGRLAPSTQPVRAVSSLQPAGRSITSPWRTPTSLPASLVTLQKYVTLHPGRHKSTPRTQLFSSETHFPAAVGFTKPDAETGEEHLSLVPGCVGGPRRGGLRLWHGMHSRRARDGKPAAGTSLPVLTETRVQSSPKTAVRPVLRGSSDCAPCGGACVCPPPPSARSLQTVCGPRELTTRVFLQ